MEVILVKNESIKLDIIKNKKELDNIKIFTLEEFKKNIFFDYNEETIYFVSKNYNVIPSIAKIYLDNLYYILDSNSNNNKIMFLKEIKDNLDKNKLLIYNPLFKDFLNNKDIKVYTYRNKFTEYMLSLVNSNIIYLNKDSKDYKHIIYELDNTVEEIEYVLVRISELIKKGVKLDNIFITNIGEEYKSSLKRLAELFNIPIELKNNDSIYSTKLVHIFMDNLDNGVEYAIDIIKKLINNDRDAMVVKEIIEEVNKYIFISDINDLKNILNSELKKVKIKSDKYSNVIREVELDRVFSDSDYVFLMNFNQNKIPSIVKDEDYLSDLIKEELGFDKSSDINIEIKEETMKKIKSIKNLVITYKIHSLEGEVYPSSLIKELNYIVEKPEYSNIIYTHKYNKIKLISYLEEYQRYNTINKDLGILLNNYEIDRYDNRFKGLDKDKLNNYIKELNLSYTSVNNYFKCSFRYYISNILNLDIYEESFMLKIGNIFHKVLERVFESDKSIEEIYRDSIREESDSYSSKEEFFLRKLESEIKFIYNTIRKQEEYSNLNKAYYEQKIVTNIDKNIKFSGKIDKIKYEIKDNKAIVSIIDYKTGSVNIELDNIKYGLDMQLPIYIYLLKHSGLFKEVEIAGFYLQRIINNIVSYNNKNSYEELREEQLKLLGYSNKDEEVIKEFDKSYMDSKVIKSLKMSKNGFYQYSKVLSNIEIDNIENIVIENINKCSKDIIDGKFDINPKEIKGENIGCKFCKFNDICYKTNKDIVVLGSEE